MLRNGNSGLKMGVSLAAHTQYAYIMEVPPPPPPGRSDVFTSFHFVFFSSGLDYTGTAQFTLRLILMILQKNILSPVNKISPEYLVCLIIEEEEEEEGHFNSLEKEGFGL